MDNDDSLSNHQQPDELEKDMGKNREAVVKVMPKSLPSFPHRLKENMDDMKIRDFMAMQK